MEKGPVRPFEVTNRMVISLAVPMTLAYLTTPLLGLTDTAVVGRLPDAALIGGLAVGAIIIDLVFATFNFLRSGTTGLTAQAVGRGDEMETQAILARSLLIALASGALIALLTPVIIGAAIFFMDPGEAVADAASSYLFIRMLGAPLALANYALLGWLIGLGRSGLGLLLQVCLNLTNIVFSVLLGLTLGFGLEGVAWATVIGEATATLAGIAIAWRLADPAARPAWKRIVDRQALWRVANLNAAIMLRSFILLFAFAFFTAQGSGFGEEVLAANAVLMNFFVIGGYFIDGLATAAEQIVGRAIGARYRPAFWQGIRLTTVWNLAFAAAMAGAFLLAGNRMIDLITTLRPVREIAYGFLPFAALTPLTGVVAFQMDGIYIGATWSRQMGIAMIVSLAAFLLAWGLLSSHGNTGLWLALNAFLLARGLSMGLWLPVLARREFASNPGPG